MVAFSILLLLAVHEPKDTVAIFRTFNISADSSSVGEPVSATVIVSADISDLAFSANFAQVMGDAG